MKLRNIATALAFAPVAALAEGETGSTDTLGTVIQDVQDGLEAMAGQILTAVGAVVIACLAFWGLRALVRWAKAYFGK